MADSLRLPRFPTDPACRPWPVALPHSDSACHLRASALPPSDSPATERPPASTSEARRSGLPRFSYHVIIPVPLQNFHRDSKQVRQRLGVKYLVLGPVAKNSSVADQHHAPDFRN